MTRGHEKNEDERRRKKSLRSHIVLRDVRAEYMRAVWTSSSVRECLNDEVVRFSKWMRTYARARAYYQWALCYMRPTCIRELFLKRMVSRRRVFLLSHGRTVVCNHLHNCKALHLHVKVCKNWKITITYRGMGRLRRRGTKIRDIMDKNVTL